MKPALMKKSGLMLSFGFLVAGWLLIATAAHAQDPGAGQEIFVKNCGHCHGAFGQGKVAVPNIAGSAGHLERFGAPPEAVGAMLTELIRNGIPGRMPVFPPEIIPDEEIPVLGAFLLANPPATGTNIYIAACAMCHGVSGEGVIGPPLKDSEQFFVQMGWSPQRVAEELRVLLDKGIPGRMPEVSYLTDLEVERLAVALTTFDDIEYWEKAFEANNGMPPTLWDRLEWAWGIEFQYRFGRPPTDAEREANAMLTRGGGGPMGPPPGAAPAGR